MRMSEDEFGRECGYQTTAYFLRKMLDEGLISESEYMLAEEKFRRKYHPVTGSLLSGKFLLCVQNRANIGIDKEGKTNEEYSET